MIIGVLLMTGLGFTIVLVSKISSERLLREQQKLSVLQLDHQKEMLRHSLIVQEQERARISGELHDGLASKLHVVRLLLATDQEPADGTQQIKKLLDEALTLTRGISHELYPPLLEELGLRSALEDFLFPLHQRMDIAFFFRGELAVDKTRDVHLFRIVQELVQNVLKHAGATRIELGVRVSAKGIFIALADNGRGFSLEAVQKSAGLKNLMSRVQLLNGRYKIKTRPAQGVRCLVKI